MWKLQPISNNICSMNSNIFFNLLNSFLKGMWYTAYECEEDSDVQHTSVKG